MGNSIYTKMLKSYGIEITDIIGIFKTNELINPDKSVEYRYIIN